MKIRNGFVSNSSSTSFVVLLPAKFNIEKDIDWEKIKDSLFADFDSVKYEDRIPESKKLVKQFIKEGYIDSDDETDRDIEVYTVRNALVKYVVLGIEAGGSDGNSSIYLLDRKRIKKILRG